MADAEIDELVEAYLVLGLGLGRHLDGLVDAYFGPPGLAEREAGAPPTPLGALVESARRLLVDLDADRSLDTNRRHYLLAQVRGLHTTARKLGGEAVGYSDEVEACYGVRPRFADEDSFAQAHARLDAALPGTGALRERLIAWRETQVVAPDKLDSAVASLSEDLRERTQNAFGLPHGENVDFELVTGQPWSGFNYFLGDLTSRVAINTDLPVLSTSLAHLVAHEAYPGHHTEHCRKEVGLVRHRRQVEESIFLVGTPQCLLAEGLADLGLEVVVPGTATDRADMAAGHLKALGVPFDPEVAAAVSEAGEGLDRVRGNVALLVHERGADPEEAVAYAERWGLLPRNRAEKMLAFLTDPTWRAYITCYVEGLPLCREFVGGDRARFERLITEQLTPDQLVAA